MLTRREPRLEHDRHHSAPDRDRTHGSQVDLQVLAPLEAVEIERPERAQDDECADHQRKDVSQGSRKQASTRCRGKNRDCYEANKRDIGCAKPVHGEARSMALPDVEPDFGTERPSTGLLGLASGPQRFLGKRLQG